MGQPELAEDPRFINNTKRCEYYLSDLKGIISAGLSSTRLRNWRK